MMEAKTLRAATAVWFLLASACGAEEHSAGVDDPTMNGASAGQTATAGTGAPVAGATAPTGAATDPVGGSGGSDSAQPAAGSSAGESGGQAGASAGPPPEVVEMLDSSVDWEALALIFPRMYSAHDGVHTFQVPVRVDGVTVELSDWQAIPSSAVIFDPDPNSEGGGVLITVVEPVPEITIAVSTGSLGGTAPLYVTEATPEQWAVGEARYNNGIEYDIPMINLLDLLLDPNYVPPETPTNLACNNCHTTGAKYLEIQHTPSQAAYISDADLETILTQGMKPEGITYSVLAPELAFLYADFHTWDASDEEIKGLIVYLRSLTPENQGEIVIPENVFIPAM